MTNLTKIEQQLTMTTREIAELTGKRHADVLRDVKMQFVTLYCEDEVATLVEHSKSGARKSEIAREYCDNLLKGLLKDDGANWRYLNNIVTFDERGYVALISLDYEHTMTLISGYEVKLRNAIVKRWQELEMKEKQQEPLFTIPKTYAQALTLAAVQAVEIEEKDKQLALAAPKVDFVDQYVDTTGKTTFRQLAKILQVNERRLRHFLKDNKIMYQLNDEWVGYSKYMKNGMLETVTGFNKDMCRSFTTTVFTTKGVNYVASYWKK